MVIIVGGGITGLAAAHELTRRGVAFVLFEASARAGGLIRTEHVDGFTMDAGPDSLLAQKPAALELCTEIGLADRLIATTPPRTAFVLKRGRLHALPSPSVLGIPTSAAALLRYDLLSLPQRARLALEPLVPRGADGDESVASFFRRRFGAAAVDLIAQPLLGGIHAGHIEELSIASLFPTMLEAERRPGGVIRNLARRRPPTPGGPFRALRGGMEELVRTLVDRMPPGALVFGAPVHELAPEGASWRVAAHGRIARAAAVLLTAPAHAVAPLLHPLDTAAGEICAGVPYVSTASVAMAWPRRAVPHPLAGSGFVVARRYSTARITACTWVSSKWEGRAPADHVLLRAFIGGAHDPAAAGLPDDELVRIAVHDVSRTLRIADPPVLARVFRAPHAGAQHTVGHAARIAALRERLRALPGLLAAGSGFDAVGIPDCIAQGRRAAAAAADYVRMSRP